MPDHGIAFSPEAWHEFYLGLEGATAALAGLLFVAMSLHLRGILAHPVLRIRAIITLGSLLTVIVVSGFMLVPGIHAGEVGTALFLLIATMLAAVVVFLPRYLRSRRTGELGSRPTGAVRGVGTLLIAGLTTYATWSLVSGSGAGLYALAALVGAMLIWAVTNCWDLLTASVEDE
jgi:modulator of FtsH protease